jgi:D-alanyl-D-alanine carboxypeptidase/D-alanyl-D-alanine-endopeptidase (penicillin-binding protein 4)
LGKDFSVRVFDPQTRSTIYSRQSLVGQVPASNLKLATAVIALKTLGPASTSTTRVIATTDPATIVIVGGGDPLLTYARINLLAKRTADVLKASPEPMTSVRVKFDNSRFAPFVSPRGWLSTYVPNQVNPVDALSIYGRTTSSPARFATKYFVQRLVAAGVPATYAGQATGAAGTHVTKVVGAPLQTAVNRMLLVSDNNIAETLARNSAIAIGQPATWAGVRASAQAQLAAMGVPMAGVSIIDGSGVSRANRLSAKALVTILRVATSGNPAFAGVQSALPIAGRTGTLKASNKRYTTRPSKCAAGKVFAKTGSLTGVLSLSGIAMAADGKPRLFSIVLNKVSTKKYTRLQIRRSIDVLAATIVGCY